MESKSKKFVAALIMSWLLLVALFLINGCKKSEPGTSDSTNTQMSQEMAEHEHEAMTAADETMSQVVTATEQTTCPIMEGNKINKDVFVEYKGKKVYFCCPDCKAKFQADPEKYIAKLPQFKQ